MKKLAIFPAVLFLIFAVNQANAQSSSTVKIENNINTTNSSDSDINSQTDIRVETNGNVTQYSSDEPNQKIEVRASDGESSIKIDGEEMTDADIKSDDEKTSTASPTLNLNSSEQENSNMENDIVKFIKDKIEAISSLFSFLDFL